MRASALIPLAMLSLSVGCESITHDEERKRLVADLQTKTAECQMLHDEIASINSKLEDGAEMRTFDEAMIGFARQIVPVVVAISPHQQYRTIWVDKITLSGRKRVSHESAPYWDASPAKPISEAMDRFGAFIEQGLSVRLAQGNSLAVTPASDLIISGSYDPDSYHTIKIQLWLSRKGHDGFSNSFVRKIKRDEINPYYLHFVNQVE